MLDAQDLNQFENVVTEANNIMDNNMDNVVNNAAGGGNGNGRGNFKNNRNFGGNNQVSNIFSVFFIQKRQL